MIIRSTYKDTAKEQFEMEVIGEGEEMGQPAYICMLLPKWRDEYQKGHEPFKLRKCLIGAIYEIVKEKKVRYEQLRLF